MKNGFLNCTVYRHSDGSARIKEWSNQNQMSDSYEIFPVGAEIIVYTSLPIELVQQLRTSTKAQINDILTDYLP